MKNNKNILTIIIAVILLASLAGGVVLVGQNNNQQRGAYFSGASLSLQPELIQDSVDKTVIAQLWVDTADNSKVNSVDTTLCYGNQSITLDSADPSDSVRLNQNAFKMIEYIDNDEKTHCLHFVVTSKGIPNDNLTSGLIKVADISFKTISPGTGNITIKKARSIIGGYNPAGGFDAVLQISKVSNSRYQILGDSASGGSASGGSTSTQ